MNVTGLEILVAMIEEAEKIHRKLLKQRDYNGAILMEFYLKGLKQAHELLSLEQIDQERHK
jgi:hypothetical protein